MIDNILVVLGLQPIGGFHSFSLESEICKIVKEIYN